MIDSRNPPSRENPSHIPVLILALSDTEPKRKAKQLPPPKPDDLAAGDPALDNGSAGV
jgi:hypothetical protein